MREGNVGLVRRLLSIIYDSLLLYAIACIVVALSLAAASLGGLIEFDDDFSNLLPAWLLLPLIIVSWITFYTWFWRREGQTLGMLALKIQLVCIDGSRPSIGFCIQRCLLAILSFALFGIGYLWIWYDQEGCCLHDRLSKSRIIYKK